jgi:hypothetical protein
MTLGLQNLTLVDDVKAFTFTAETSGYNTAELLHCVHRMSVRGRQGTQQINPRFAPGICNAYNVVIKGEQRIKYATERWHNYNCAHPSLWKFMQMSKIDITKMNKKSKHIHTSINQHHQCNHKHIMNMVLRHQVYKLNCMASYFQGAAHRLTTNPTTVNKNDD